MDRVALTRRVWTGSRPVDRLVRAVLEPLSWLYGAVMWARGALYDQGVLTSHRIGVPVVGVGNLCVGGTGKTPFVLWAVQELTTRGRRVVVVSRGYGGSGRTVVVDPGNRGDRVREPPDHEERAIAWVEIDGDGHIQGDWPDASDEALLVALRARVPVVSDSDRVMACRVAGDLFSPDVIVLDDGFQHRRLARDLDIVLVGAGDRRARVLPAGPLREPPTALARADIVVASDEPTAEPWMRKIPTGLVRWPAEPMPVVPLESVCERRVVAFAGIARPERFFAVVESLQPRQLEVLRFPDHYRYDGDDWQRLALAARNADWIITTEKDLVKVARLADEDPRLVALRIDVRVAGGSGIIDRICALDAPRRGHHDRGTDAFEAEERR